MRRFVVRSSVSMVAYSVVGRSLAQMSPYFQIGGHHPSGIANPADSGRHNGISIGKVDLRNCDRSALRSTRIPNCKKDPPRSESGAIHRFPSYGSSRLPRTSLRPQPTFNLHSLDINSSRRSTNDEETSAGSLEPFGDASMMRAGSLPMLAKAVGSVRTLRSCTGRNTTRRIRW
jgi:hypothetical protein